MAASLECLHVELVEMIVGYLDFADLASLRLASRALEAKVTQGSFVSRFFQRKAVEVTTRMLEEFVYVTGAGRLGCHLQHCTLTGIARNKLGVGLYEYITLPSPKDPDEDPERDLDKLPEEDSAEHVRLLSEAFANLKAHSPKGGLASLHLAVGPRTKYLPEEEKRRGEKKEGETGGEGDEEDEGEKGKEGTESKDGLELAEAGNEESESDSGADGDRAAPVKPVIFLPSWRAVWDAATRTFQTATAALAAAEMPVTDHLDVFGGLRACSLAHDAFLDLLRGFPSRRVFAELRRLTLSLSARHRSAAAEWAEQRAVEADEMRQVMADAADSTEAEEAVVARLEAEAQEAQRGREQADARLAARVLQGIAAPSELGGLMPALAELDLHWYQLGKNMAPQAVAELPPPPEPLQGEIADSTPAPRIRSASLHGLRLRADDFCRFLDAVRPARLALDYARFTTDAGGGGGFRDVFLPYLADPACPVTSYVLDDVVEDRKLVHYADVPGTSKYRYLGEVLGPSTLSRDGALAARQPVRTVIPSHRPLGSGPRTRWVTFKGEEFGPRTSKYDFVRLNRGAFSGRAPGHGYP